MLHSFGFSNFCSFKDYTEVSFEVGKHAPDNNIFMKTSIGTRVPKTMVVIGPNASGKTNFLKTLSFMQFFIANSFREIKEKEPIPLDMFQFSEKKKRFSKFEVIFEIKHRLYRYTLKCDRLKVVEEQLDEKINQFQYLFKRNWNGKEYDIRQQHGLGLEIKSLKSVLRKNASLMSTAAAIENKVLSEIVEYWRNMQTNVTRTGKSKHNNLLETAEFFAKNKLFKTKADSILSDMDLGLNNILIKKEQVLPEGKKEPESRHFPYGIHSVEGETYILPFFYESSGTQNLFILLQYILPALKTGGIVVLDELEVDLHPHMIPPIVEQFTNPQTNPYNAQLIFSSHSISILQYMDKTQVLLVEKDENCESDIWRLDTMQGVRRDDNLYAKYNAGAYGAVPDI